MAVVRRALPLRRGVGVQQDMARGERVRKQGPARPLSRDAANGSWARRRVTRTLLLAEPRDEPLLAPADDVLRLLAKGSLGVKAQDLVDVHVHADLVCAVRPHALAAVSARETAVVAAMTRPSGSQRTRVRLRPVAPGS